MFVFIGFYKADSVNTYLSKNDWNALKITNVEFSFTEHVHET